MDEKALVRETVDVSMCNQVSAIQSPSLETVSAELYVSREILPEKSGQQDDKASFKQKFCLFLTASRHNVRYVVPQRA